MGNKQNKNIDQLFKDRLQGMESTPPPVVWENIQAALDAKKRDRKVIPLWWKLGGVAAALVLLFSVGNMMLSDNPDSVEVNDHQFVVEDQNKTTPEIDTNVTPNESSQKSVVNNDEENSGNDTQNAVVASQNTNDVVTTNESRAKIIKSNNSTVNNTKHTATATIANNNASVTQQKSPVTTEKLIAKNTKVVANTAVQNTSNSINNTIEKGKVDSVIINDGITNTNTEKEKNTLEKEVSPENNKESIFDAIEEENEAVAKNTDELPADRWAISPNVAPVYYNSLSQGSSIDPAFADNTQNGEINMSYGINVSYAVSPRLTVRSGVNNVNLSYATGGLELATGDASAALQAVNFDDKGIVVTAVDLGTLSNVAPGSPYENLTRKATDGEVFLTQNISYTEIPAELTYALVNKKLGVNLIGGFSTLLLGNNEVSVSANNFEDVLGEANNLSDVSFSTNVGLGLSYQLTRKFKFNVEPMFKYQLNPYTDNTVQFKPYYVGVYSGLSFKF